MRAYPRKSFIIFLAVLAKMTLTPPVCAEGISVTSDLKHARGNHTVFVLNETQIKDVERNRQVVLTDEQLKPLRGICAKIPRKLKVLSSRYDGCTCLIKNYGIWCRVGELDVPHKDLSPEGENEQPVEYWEDDYISISRTIILDSQGDMYLDAKKLSEDQLRAEIDEVSSTEVESGKEVSRTIWFDTPPPINEDVDNKIRNLIDQTKAYCKGKDVSFYAIGFRRE
jgi:hypothetical protein